MGYLMFKHAHMAMAFVTLALFVGRGLHRLVMEPQTVGPVQKSFNYMSYGVDILLLVLGLYLLTVWAATEAPLMWVGTKLIFLVLYIAVGVFAFRPVLPKPYRWLCFSLAVLLWVLMYKTAKLKVPFWQWFG